MRPDLLLEGFVVDVLARAAASCEYCSSLLALDHVSAAPKNLAKTIRKVCSFLALAVQRIEADYHQGDKNEKAVTLAMRQLQNVDNLIRELAAQLRYVESATTYKLPWTIVSAFENWVQTFLGEVTLMLRPQWRYNYTFTLWDFRANYILALEEFQDLVPSLQVEDNVLDSLKTPFYLIAFPALERDNILLHTLLGHEIGHLLVDRFLTDNVEAEFVASILGEINRIAKKDLADGGISSDIIGEILRPQAEQTIVAKYVQIVRRCWRRALEELLSDIAGAILFGPAALFSTFDLAFQRGYDQAPSPNNNFYPPWRMRLREVVKAMESVHPGFFPFDAKIFPAEGADGRVKALREHLSTIHRAIESRSDYAKIDRNPLVRLAYTGVPEFIRRGQDFLLKECGLSAHAANPEVIYEAMPDLIERLDRGIPPNATDEAISGGRISSFVEIINSAWLHKLSSEHILDREAQPLEQEVLVLRDRRNRLTLKAIEYADLARRYGAGTEK